MLSSNLSQQSLFVCQGYVMTLDLATSYDLLMNPY